MRHKVGSTRGVPLSLVALDQLLEECAAAMLLLVAESVSGLLLEYRLTL